MKQTFWTLREFRGSIHPEWASNCLTLLEPYVNNFLVSNHPYRDGKVCPFMPSAIKEDRVFISYIHNVESDIEYKLNELLEGFIEFKKSKKELLSLLVLFPSNSDISNLLNIHYRFKKISIKYLLMLGLFYPTNQATSLHSKSFYPLRTPTPIFVIRDIVFTDLVFMNQKRYFLIDRIKFLSSYIRKYSKNNSMGIQQEVLKAKNIRISIFLKLLLLCVAIFCIFTMIILYLYGKFI
jgi:hypothetical protein